MMQSAKGFFSEKPHQDHEFGYRYLAHGETSRYLRLPAPWSTWYPGETTREIHARHCKSRFLMENAKPVILFVTEWSANNNHVIFNEIEKRPVSNKYQINEASSDTRHLFYYETRVSDPPSPGSPVRRTNIANS